ncbi:hypothetical protein Mesau_05982 [Mesorhizobium australicum WSM2073]|uniref:Uncharacterized protein n=1 Tax=Mesorhizobium australicum (strain HAMBI 3006 / LMG 24608 / WSM2073) TaxID=754035 RepID=L0KVV2_MESAW|nr:hypothetical protein Mesau_05982 [Mesorhizobium australicum WSM2073]
MSLPESPIYCFLRDQLDDYEGLRTVFKRQSQRAAFSLVYGAQVFCELGRAPSPLSLSISLTMPMKLFRKRSM